APESKQREVCGSRRSDWSTQAELIPQDSNSHPAAIHRCHFYTSLSWHGVRAGMHETLAAARRGVRLRIRQDSKARLRDTRRSRSQFPTPQSLLRLANPFRTRLRCDADRANAPPLRAKPSSESNK